MQQGVVDPFGKETVAALLEHRRVTAESRPPAGVRLGRDLCFSVDVPARSGCTVFNIPQLALAPEFAAYLVRLSAIHQEFTRKTPMAIIFKPGAQAMLMTHLAESAHVIISHLVGHHTTHVPQKTVGRELAANNKTLEHGKERNGIVAIFLLKGRKEVVGKILSPGFVAVLHHHLKGLPVSFRDALQYFTDMGIEMALRMFFAHFVNFVTGCFGRSRAVGRSCGNHPRAHNDPFAFRNIPVECAVGRKVRCNVCHLRRIDHRGLIVRFSLKRPLILMPVGQRRREHFCQGLLRITVYAGRSRKRQFGNPAGRIGIFDDQPVCCRLGRWKRYHNRGIGIEADMERRIGTFYLKFSERAETAILSPGLQHCGPRERMLGEADREAARCKRLCGLQANNKLSGGRKTDRGLHVGVCHFLRPCHLGGRGNYSIFTVQHKPVIFRSRVSNHFDILKKRIRLLQFLTKLLRPLHPKLRSCQVAHSFFRFHPGPARLAPSRRIKNADLDVQFRRRLQRRMDDIPPFFTQHFHLPVRQVVEPDIPDEGPVNTGFFH